MTRLGEWLCRIEARVYCDGCDRIVWRTHNRLRCRHPPIPSHVMAEIIRAAERRRGLDFLGIPPPVGSPARPDDPPPDYED